MTSFLGLWAYALFCYAFGWWMCERKHAKDEQEARLAKVESRINAWGESIPVESLGRDA